MMTIPQLQQIKTILQQSPELVLCCHTDPDGDALGSLLGLGLALKNQGHKMQLVSPDGVPFTYDFLPGVDNIASCPDFVHEKMVAIVLDCGDLQRLGPLADKIILAQQIINIDHHATNTKFGTINWVDPAAAATAEMIYFLLKELALPIDLEIATCIYTGIHTDTGGFSYENTTAKAHEVAKTLLQLGVQPWLIADNVYSRKTRAQLKLIQLALEQLQVSPDGLIAWISLPYDRFGSYSNQDTGGLINYPRMVAGTEVAILFRENEPEQVRVGFRSRNKVDVGLLAQQLGGGGHARAAGCILSGPIGRVEKQVLAATWRALREVKKND